MIILYLSFFCVIIKPNECLKAVFSLCQQPPTMLKANRGHQQKRKRQNFDSEAKRCQDHTRNFIIPN